MVNDYSQNKTPIFTGINDSPVEATSESGSNASDLIDKVNTTLDWLNQDFENLEGGAESWQKDTVIYFDTTDGDSSNDGLTDTTPLLSFQEALTLLKTKEINDRVEIRQLDTATWQLDSIIDFTDSIFGNSSEYNNFVGNEPTFNSTYVSSTSNYSALTFRDLSFQVNSDFIDFGDTFPVLVEFFNCNITFDTSANFDYSPQYYFNNCTLLVTSNNAYTFSFNELSGYNTKIFVQNCTFDDNGSFAYQPFDLYGGGFHKYHFDGVTLIGWNQLVAPHGYDCQIYINNIDASQSNVSNASLVNQDRTEPRNGVLRYIDVNNAVNGSFNLFPFGNGQIKLESIREQNTVITRNSNFNYFTTYLGDIQLRNYKLLFGDGYVSEFVLDIVIDVESGDFDFDLVLGTTVIASGLNSDTFNFSNVADTRLGFRDTINRDNQDLKINVTSNNTATNVIVAVYLFNG